MLNVYIAVSIGWVVVLLCAHALCMVMVRPNQLTTSTCKLPTTTIFIGLANSLKDESAHKMALTSCIIIVKTSGTSMAGRQSPFLLHII